MSSPIIPTNPDQFGISPAALCTDRQSIRTESKKTAAVAAMKFLVLGTIITITASCATRGQVSYSGYEKIPDSTTSAVFRAVQKSIPYTSKHAFWGNYGGSGNAGGKPVDEMDELFRRHDIVYREAKSLPVLREADRQLIAALQRIDPATIPPDGREFRDTAIRFMDSPLAEAVGKPFSAILRTEEPKWSCFQTKKTVVAFFDRSNPALPDLNRDPVFRSETFHVNLRAPQAPKTRR